MLKVEVCVSVLARVCAALIVVPLSIVVSVASDEFDTWFTGETLRVDYDHVGTADEEHVALERVRIEGPWPGSRTQLIDTSNLGKYLVEVVDLATHRVLYTRGFAGIFGEWETTGEAGRGIWRSTREGAFGWYWNPAGGTGSAEPLTTGPNLKNADSWSADGKLLAFSELSTTAGMDLLLLSMEGERAVRPLLRTPFNEWLAEISPDGRWMAYGSNEDGQPQVYVRPFPDVEQWKEQISTEGGDFPVWSPDGRELFYLSGQTMMVVSVDGATPFTAGTPEPLFSRQYFTDQASRNYDVTRDGRFLMVKESEEGAETPPQTEIIVVENWFEELKRLAPVDGN